MTSTSTDPDASEDVNDFLLRIRELGEKRDKEDEERTKKLEEEILQGRRERQARRAERARSISPTKDSPLPDTTRLSTSSLNQRVIDPPENLEPTVPASDFDASCASDQAQEGETTATESRQAVSKSTESEMDSPPRQTPTSARSRTGTLSSQRRPTSSDLNYNHSFGSTFPTRENRLRTVATVSDDDQDSTRDQTTSPRFSQDTSPLRQSTSRQSDSPEPRKHPDEVPPDVIPNLNATPNLRASQGSPETSRGYNTEPEKTLGDPDKGEEQAGSPSRPTSTIGDNSLSHRYSRASSVSTAPGLGSPVPLSSAQKFETRKTEQDPEDQAGTPPSPRRMSPERSTSPTKGLGGFVQSAMMKRSDSVTKRWSSQMPSGLTGLSRTNSIVSNRSSLASPTRNDMPSTPTGSRFGRESVSSSPKRPGSVHSEATILQHTRENGRPSTPPAPASASNTRTEESPSRQPSSLHKRSSSALGWEDQNSGSPLTSRTMDSKRWSPTKASWLESALNRPESPRHMKQPSQQSPWSRERQSRGSVDFGRRGSFKEVTPVGLMRSTAPGSHFKKPSVSSIPDPPSSPSKIKEAESEGIHEAESEPIKEVASETTTEANPDPASAKDNDRPSSEDLPDSPSSIENASQQEPEPTTVAEDTAKDKPESSSPKVHSRFSSISREPAAPKPTSQSPVVDFRGNLRRREVAKDSSPKEEPEFKNVFGKLRRTQTSNYVAPDELKNNILRGKAALNVTGGPKKTQRVDEFKESILKQKEAMKAGGGSLRRNTAGEDDAPGKPAAAVPEAIAKRNHMATASISKSARSPDAPSSPSTKNPEAPDHAQDHQESPLSPLSNELPADSEPLQPPPADNTDPEQSERRVEDPVSPNNENGDESKTAPLDEKPDERSVEEKPTGSIEGGIKPVRDSPSGDAAEAIKAPAVTEGLSTKGKLAGRINPALAGLLSRGPPAAASAGPKASAIGESTSVTPQNTSAAPLTHMTKGRAKGPKRRLPRATAADTTSPREGGEPRSPSPTTTSLDTEQTQEVRSTFDKSVDDTSSPALPEPQRGPPLARETTPEQAPFSFTDEPSKVRNLPEAMFKDQSAELRQSSSQSTLAEGKNNQPGDGGVGQAVANQEDNTPSEGALSPMPSSVGSPSGTSGGLPESQEDVLPSAPESPQEQMPSPSTARSKPSRPFHGYQEDAFLSEPAMPPKAVPSPLNSPSEPGQGVHENQENTVPPAPAVPHNEVGSPLASPSETIRGSRDLYSSPSPSPLKTNTKENRMPSMDPQKSTPTKFGVGGPRDMSLRGKPLPTPPAPLEITSDKRFDQPPPSPVPSSRVPSSSLISDAAQSKEVISSFFNTFPSPNARVDIDPQSILTSQSDGPKIRTLKKQIWEITGDVKRQDLPPSQEYILYEGSMYLLVHVFEVDSATRAEVQLWCGDDVPEAAVDDAQSFARKVARENGCKLELLKQGKETARFIRALGGILITRRGFNSRSTSSSLYMLCGRRHMGEMVFDEVDLSRRNLCSGYPFVISAPFGNLYLWKGKGSGAEEVGAARLIGIDLGLTGEIEEVAEGEEPESFFENFPDYKGSGDYVRSEYWQLKPNHARFQTRLLRIDHELGQRSFWMRRPGTSSPVTRPNDTLQEIVPFRYKDLTSRGIFILDIFFEIYVVVGDQASQRSAEFASAVVFAHEYGILAASLQDRPFIPKTFVSIGGLPDSCRSVFRKWDKRSWQIPLRVLTLNAAIEAIRS